MEAVCPGSRAASGAGASNLTTGKPSSASRKERTACGSAGAFTGFSINQRPRTRRTVISPSARRTVNFSTSSGVNWVRRGSRNFAAGPVASSTTVSGTRRISGFPPTRANTSSGRAVFAPNSMRSGCAPRRSRRKRGAASPASATAGGSGRTRRSRTVRKRSAVSRRSTSSGAARSSTGATINQPAASRRRLTVSVPRMMSISAISSGSKTVA